MHPRLDAQKKLPQILKLLQTYYNFMNGYAKHHDKTELNVLEYLMYQTGNIIRLLVTLKQAEPVTENEIVL